jgi:hypothetical protein
VDKTERQKLPLEIKDRLLGLFVVREINKTLGVGEKGPWVEEPFLKL